MPTPRTTRPLETRSSVIASSATRTGWCSGNRMTEVPTRRRCVRAATAVATMSGGQEPVVVVVVLAEKARVEATRLGELGFSDDVVDTAIEVLATRGAGDRAVEAKFHVYTIPL